MTAPRMMRMLLMQHKLIMTWDIQEGHEREYFDFLIHTFIPRMGQLGFELGDAWATIYGANDVPQVQICAVLPDALEAERRMAQQDWKVLLDRLFEYVENFQSKLVPAGSGFQF